MLLSSLLEITCSIDLPCFNGFSRKIMMMMCSGLSYSKNENDNATLAAELQLEKNDQFLDL